MCLTYGCLSASISCSLFMCFTFFLSLVIVFFGWCRTSDIVFICLPRGLRGVAVLALLRSSHSHICLGNGYSVVEVHGGSLEAPLTFPLPNFFRIFPLLFKFFSFKLVNYKKPSLCRAFSKFPSLGRQREGQKLTPLKNSFVLAPNWSHFPVQDCSWLRNGAIFRLWHQN